MVLQRAPQSAVVWGHTKPFAKVTTTFDSKTLVTTADINGTWRQRLPPMPASMKPYTLAFVSSTGETAALHDVLFGEVYICSGQSNMQYAGWKGAWCYNSMSPSTIIHHVHSTIDRVPNFVNAFQHFTGSWLGAPIPNATVERARANNYPNVRLFTVGQGNQSATPFQDLQTVLQPWTVASNASLMGEGALPEERIPVSLTGFSVISKVLVPVWRCKQN